MLCPKKILCIRVNTSLLLFILYAFMITGSLSVVICVAFVLVLQAGFFFFIFVSFCSIVVSLFVFFRAVCKRCFVSRRASWN